MAGKNRPRVFVVAQFVVVAVAMVFPLLVDLGYDPLDAEVIVLSGIAAVMTLPLAMMAARWPLVRRLAFAILMCWLLDLYFFESELFWWAALALVALSLSPFESNLRNVGALFAGCFTLLSALSPTNPAIAPALSAPVETTSSARRDSPLPLVVHIILDEQGSPLAASPESGRIFDRLAAEYTERGFESHTWVRAGSGATDRSLAGLLAPPPMRGTDNNRVELNRDFTYSLRRNYYVESLLQRGFKVSVLQNSYLQLCVDERADCYTYPHDTHGHSMARFTGSLSDRLWLAVTEMHSEQYSPKSVRYVNFYKPIGDKLVVHGLFPYQRQFWTGPSVALAVLDEFERRIPKMRSGEAYLVHLLAPHYPYVLDANCGLRPASEWMVPDWAAQVFGQSRAELEHVYWEQVSCVHSRLLTLIDRIDREVGRDNSVIILHGDHGARLFYRMAHPRPEIVSATEPNSSLDTILLVRAPGAQAILNSARASLDELLWGTLAKYSLIDE